MADESSDEDIDVQNGYDGELDIFLPDGSVSDTNDSAGNASPKNDAKAQLGMILQ